MISAWWLAPAIGISLIAGFGFCLVLAAIIRTRPMDARHYSDVPHTVEELLRDMNGQENR